MDVLVQNPNATKNSTTGEVSFDNLYPAILQCFVIILMGYISGRAGLITATQSKGIGTFVSTFCLPALLFKNMCELQFDLVNWMFLLGILIAKSAIFIVVSIVTLIAKRPMNLGYAGLFGIFATQSNDFALGYPILQALYGNSHPEYLHYIYLIAPISLVLLNPIGFVLMEIHHRHTTTTHSHTRCGLVGQVLQGVLMNPIVFMTIIGIACNFIFHQQTPAILSDILQVLGDAFSGSALFYLGMNLVGKVQGQLGMNLLAPMLLIAAKTLMLPLVTWEVVSWLETGASTNESEALSMYGFLYGTFPTAPSVFLYASKYGIAQDVVATGMVACTFLSAPLMFVSARMMTLIVNSELDYKSLLMDTSFDASIVSLIGCLWVLGVLFLSRRWKRMPHRLTACFAISQVVACVGMILYNTSVNTSNQTVRYYVQVILLLVGVFASRCWTAMLALALCLIHVRSMCFVLRHQIWFFFFGFGLPILVTGLIFLVGYRDIETEIDPSFHFGWVQTLTSVCILAVCTVITVTSLIVQVRYDRLSHGNSASKPEEKVKRKERGGRDESCTALNGDTGQAPLSPRREEKSYQSVCTSSLGASESIEDIVPFPKPGCKEDEASLISQGSQASSSGASETLLYEAVNERTCLLGKCDPRQRQECSARLRSYLSEAAILQDDPQMESSSELVVQTHECQTGHHLVLLLLLLVSMFIGLFLCIWRMFNQHPTGIYIEVEFLDGVFNYGQGFFLFAVFGFDTRLVFSPVIRRVRRWLYGVEIVHLPKPEELEEETRQTCEQFVEYHKEQCAKHIQQDLRYRFRTYKKVFTGTKLCDWLIKVGLAKDRGEAVLYGQRLLLGRIISHVTSEHHFHDLPYFYKFLNTEGYLQC